VIALNATN